MRSVDSHSVVIKVALYSLYPMKSAKKSKERPSLDEIRKETQIKIGKRLRELREGTDLSQEKFANEHLINRRLMSRIENGTNFKIDTLMEYLYALDISFKEFAAGIE